MAQTEQLPLLPPVHPIARRVALASLFLLTLGFAGYQLVVRLGFLPPVLGGYLGIMGVALVGPCLIAYLLQIAKDPWRFNRGDLLFIAFMMMFGTVALFHLLSGSRVVNAQSHLVAFTQMVDFFVIYYLLDLRAPATKILHWVMLLILSAIMLTLQLGVVDPNAGYDEIRLVPDENIAGYMHYSLVYFFVLIGCIAIAPTQIVRLGVYALATATLFYNGARSELIVAIPIFLMSEALLSRRNMFLFGALSLLFLFVAAPFANLLIEMFPQNRAISLVVDLAADQSVQEREFISENALEVIRKNPIFGDYAYYPEGLYAHNMLSVWADFGLFGMVLFLMALIFPLGSVLDNGIKNRIDPELLAFACFTVASLLLFTFAKAYTHPIFGVVLALYSRQLTRKVAAVRRQDSNNLFRPPVALAPTWTTTNARPAAASPLSSPVDRPSGLQ